MAYKMKGSSFYGHGNSSPLKQEKKKDKNIKDLSDKELKDMKNRQTETLKEVDPFMHYNWIGYQPTDSLQMIKQEHSAKAICNRWQC